MNGARANFIVGIVIGFVILLAVVAGILWCDALTAVSLVKQYRSTTFAQTPGRILSSNLRHEEGGRRSLSSYTVEVSYSYAVAGQTYQGKRYRTALTISHREDGPRRIVSELPAGKEVTVCYNPAAPAEAVLSPGLTPADFLDVHLLLPFNCPLLIAACVLGRLARARSHPAGGAAFVERGAQTRIRLHPLTAAEKALGITGLISLVIALALMIFTDPFVSAAVAVAVWATVPLIFGVAYFCFRRRGYLVLDAREGLIKIPSGKRGERALEIPWAQVTELRFAAQERTSAHGLTSVACTVVLAWRNKRGRDKERTLITWNSEYCAKRFFVWLYPRLMESAPRPAKDSGPFKIPPSPAQGNELFGRSRSAAGDFYEQALVCEQEADHDGALLALDQAIQLDGAHSDALYVRGLVHEITGDYKKALADLKAARKLKPTSVDCLDVDWNRKPVSVLRTGPRQSKSGRVTDADMAVVIRKALGNDMARIHTRQANAHYDQQEFDKAIEKYSHAISLQETWVRYYERGRAFCCARQFMEAIDDLRRAIESGPESDENLSFPASAHYFLGKSHRESGQFDQAVTELTKSIQLAPDVSVSYEDRAKAYRDLGDEARAAEDERKAEELSQEGPQQGAGPQSAEEYLKYLRRAQDYVDSGDYERAVADCTKAIRLDPNYPTAYGQRGIALDLSGRPDEAIADFTEVIRIDPHNALAYSNRGNTYSNTGKLKKAIADYTEAIRLDPANPVRYAKRARTYEAAGQAEHAAADEKKAEELTEKKAEELTASGSSPQNGMAFYERGNMHAKHGEFDKAIADFTEAIRLRVINVCVYHARGCAFAENGEHDEAIADFTEAIRLAPNEPGSYVQRGGEYDAIEDWDKALADYTEAIRLCQEPARLAVLYGSRGLTWGRKGEYDREMADLRESIRLNPTPMAFMARGNAHLGKAAYDQAIADFTEAIRLDPNLRMAYPLRADAYRALGDDTNAARDEEQAQETESWPKS